MCVLCVWSFVCLKRHRFKLDAQVIDFIGGDEEI